MILLVQTTRAAPTPEDVTVTGR